MSSIYKTIVSIRFYGKNLNPKEVERLLGFRGAVPFESTIKNLRDGDVVWTIRLENDEPLENKIETLLHQFTNEIYLWKQIPEHIKADIFCGLFLEEWNQGFDLTPKIMSELSLRNLEIGFDIYSPTESWDQLTE